MTFHDLEQDRVEKALAVFLEKRRPPVNIRSQLDIGFRLVGQSVELIEIRPQWDDPKIIREQAFAKATYVKAQNVWKIFWQRSDLKWHGYEPVPTVPTIEEFLSVVNQDEYSCFFG
jgi:hypothetical protein